MSAADQQFRDAVTALSRQDLAGAEKQLRDVVRHEPKHFDALNLLGIALMMQGRYAEAEPFVKSALGLNAAHDAALSNYGFILKSLSRPAEALEPLGRALAINPNNPVTWNNRGAVLSDLKRYAEAAADFDKATSLEPRFADAFCSKGNALLYLHRYDEALAAYDRALSVNANLADAWLGRGNVFRALKRYEQALAAYERAIGLNAKLEGAWIGRGNVFADLKRHGDAVTAYDQAFALKPDAFGLEGSRLHARMQCCDWLNYQADCAHLLASIAAGKAASHPFFLTSIDASAADQLRCATAWCEESRSAPSAERAAAQPPKDGKIRLGYLSADLCEHAVAQLSVGVFEHHDRSRFEIAAFSTGPNDKSALRGRLEKAFDSFIDLENCSDAEIAETIRSRNIDLLVDLTGHTRGARLGVLARRPAPVQLNYLGYPGTMGAEEIDYIVADRVLIPAEDRGCYSEKVVTLPHSYQANDRSRPVADKVFTKEACGLPANAFVFCCFNNNYKITPAVFDAWMKILRRADGSVLWLLHSNEAASSNLRKEAGARGVDPSRVIFAKSLPMSEHLARIRCADLFLDTLPYNAHTTASDALWVGLPVLTRAGDTFAGRVAASILTAIGLPELITHSAEDYAGLAIDLAHNRDKLVRLRDRLNANRTTTPLFDIATYTRNLEAAYAKIFDRHRAGLPSDHMVIEG